MKIAISHSNDPYYNLSLEEALLKDVSIKENLLLIYVNKNSIIFGRNQNVHEEINNDFVSKNHIKLVRRVSGGGTVYHDEGNINFSFITREHGSYDKFLKPIIAFLYSLHLDAKFSGKNDITVNGFKISGNAQYQYQNKMFHHGTLLFDANLEVLSHALKPNPLKLASKSIKSARQRVSNINDLLENKMTPKQFQEKLVSFFINHHAKLFDLENYYNDSLDDIVAKNKSEDWIFGKNPKFNVSNELRFDGGTIKFNANVVNNLIVDIKFEGDFLSKNDFENIYQQFINVPFLKEKVKHMLENIDDFSDYFGKISSQEILQLMFS